MELIGHTLTWCRGEIFEGNMALIYGLVVLIISFAFWKYGHTPYARGIIIPLAAVAILFISIGIYLNLQNHHRIPEYQKPMRKMRKNLLRKRRRGLRRLSNGIR